MDELNQWRIALLLGITIAAFLAWFNKSGSDFKNGFKSRISIRKEKK